jgi:hypothetical protein
MLESWKIAQQMLLQLRESLATLTTTCEASEKFGPGDRFLFGAGGVEFATPPPLDPFRFRRLLAGRWASLIELSEFNLMMEH